MKLQDLRPAGLMCDLAVFAPLDGYLMKVGWVIARAHGLDDARSLSVKARPAVWEWEAKLVADSWSMLVEVW